MIDTRDHLAQIIEVSGEKERGKKEIGEGGREEERRKTNRGERRWKGCLMITCGFIEFLARILKHFCASPPLFHEAVLKAYTSF